MKIDLLLYIIRTICTYIISTFFLLNTEYLEYPPLFVVMAFFLENPKDYL